MIPLLPDDIVPRGARVFIVVLFGLLLGSFTSALSYRVPRGMKWRGGRSVCPSCHATLTAPDLIPILSWLILRGRCRHCGAAIGWRYPAIEATVLACCLALYATWGFSVGGFLAMAAMPFLLTLLLVDLKQMILPDAMQVALGAVGILFAITLSAVAPQPVLTAAIHGIGFLVYGGLFWLTGWVVGRVRHKDALGFGDVKFVAIAGLWLGLPTLPIFLIASGVTGVVFGLTWRLAGRGSIFPFGPALIFAFYACLLLKGAGFPGADLLY